MRKRDTSATAAVKSSCNVDDNRYQREDSANLAAYLYWLKQKQPTEYGRIVATIQLAIPDFEDFVLAPLRRNEQMIRLEWKQHRLSWNSTCPRSACALATCSRSSRSRGRPTRRSCSMACEIPPRPARFRLNSRAACRHQAGGSVAFLRQAPPCKNSSNIQRAQRTASRASQKDQASMTAR